MVVRTYLKSWDLGDEWNQIANEGKGLEHMYINKIPYVNDKNFQ